jgi:peptide/nickel transport system substrate-binding protein
MHANSVYHGGRPILDHITFKPYSSLRSAWADLLRGQVDVLYDVGPEALNSLESSREVRIFPFQRAQAYVVLFNLRRPFLADSGFRRDLNAAIDRAAMAADAFGGHATPAAAAISPRHWAYSADLPQFRYKPRVRNARSPKQLTCLFMDPSIERLALLTQRQLQAIDVDLQLKLVTPDEALGRLESGDFDAVLGDFELGPNLARAYNFWHSGGPYNFGRYNSKPVDAALDSVRHAADDTAYKAGVAAFERAIVDDPPGIFLAWGERARAVSSRFDVPTDPDAAIFRTLHLWRPGSGQLARLN